MLRAPPQQPHLMRSIPEDLHTRPGCAVRTKPPAESSTCQKAVGEVRTLSPALRRFLFSVGMARSGFSERAKFFGKFSKRNIHLQRNTNKSNWDRGVTLNDRHCR